MFEDVSANNLKGEAIKARLKTVPDVCPICHRNIQPKHIISAYFSGVVQAIYRCTNQKCQELFIATYDKTGERISNSMYTYKLRCTAPKKPEKASFPDSIETISPTFIEIYNQAVAAESVSLEQLVGIGLRKALEFLIKDYAISEHKDEEDSIRKIMLGRCIDKYVTDHKVKQCAKRAAWLGNDETHYTRKWEDKDIEDLKMLVRLTVHWIDSEVITKQYMESMK